MTCKRSTLGAIGLALMMTATGAQAQQATRPSPVAGWDAMADGIRDLPAEMLSRLPQSMQDDPQVRQEVGRLALAAVTSYGLDTLGADGDHPVFLPTIGQVLSIGQPNADTVYRTAKITPGGTYRLRGTRGSLRIATVALSSPTPSKPQSGSSPDLGPRKVDYDINALKIDEQGRFDVMLSPTRPAGYSGDWWQSTPETAVLLVRMVSSDWAQEVDPKISIERLDAPAPRPRPSAAELEQRLRSLPVAATFIGTLLLAQPEKLRQEGYVNKLKGSDFAQQGGLSKQYYYEGVYDLGSNEALLLEARLPARCSYRSLILTNEIYETTDWTNNQSSLNDSQSKPDADGVLRVVISARDPGVPNWLATAGYPTGVIQGRWFDCDSQPIPTLRKVPLADLHKILPAATPTVTPAERERIIRERRTAYEQRSKW